MMEQKPVQYKIFESFSRIRDEYFSGGLKSYEAVGIDNVKVLNSIYGGTNPSMLLLGMTREVPMWASLEKIIENQVGIQINDTINVRGLYINNAPQDKGYNFPDQMQESEYLRIMELLKSNEYDTIQAP